MWTIEIQDQTNLGADKDGEHALFEGLLVVLGRVRQGKHFKELGGMDPWRNGWW